MNEYDSRRILDLTKKINYIPTRKLSEAHCYVLNTCHIREKATDKVYHDVGRLKKEFRNKTKPIVIRFLKNVDEILCVDSEKYGPFKAEDIATLPNENAQQLISNKTATKIRIEE